MRSYLRLYLPYHRVYVSISTWLSQGLSVPRYSTHGSTRAVIAYAWHPRCGTEVSIVTRRERNGERLVNCRLPDDRVVQLPWWMIDATVCAQHSFGAPRASVTALVELRRVLDALRTENACDTSGSVLSQEDARVSSANSSTAASAVPQSTAPSADSARRGSASRGATGRAATASSPARAGAKKPRS